MSDRKDLPAVSANNFDQRVRETIQTYLGRQGDPLDRGLTLRDLIENGIIKLPSGWTLRPGGGSIPLLPGDTITVDEEPDLTPPPSPTGFTATAGLSYIIVEHDLPNYTQGRGHLRTRLYGATWTTTLPTFADAVEIAQFTGQVYAHPTSLGTKWRLWAKWETIDNVLSVSPAGGTNGVAAQTGLVGNADLTDAIITAGKIANGAIDLGGAKITGLLANANMAVITDPTKIADFLISNTKLADLAVTASKIASGAITLTKFASGIEPITIVTGSLPTTKSTETIVFNGKLYRWNGTAYVATVPTTDLTGTLADAQIAAVAASKVTGQLTDAQLADIAAAKLTGQITSTQITDSAISTPKLAAGAITSAKIAANTIVAANIAAGTITGTEIAAGTITGAKIAAGTIQAGNIAAGTITGDRLAANTITASNIAADTITAAQIAAGAISASELAAGAVTAGKIATGAIIANDGVIANAAITNALIANAAVGSAQIVDAAITAAKIGTAAVGSAAIENLAVTNAKIANLAIDDAKIASLSAAKITAGTIAADRIGANSITADKIDSRGLTIKDARGNIILQSGSQPISAISSFLTTYRWDFRGTLNDFTATGATLTSLAEWVEIDSTGADPILASADLLGISGALYSKIQVRIKRLAGTNWDGTVYYSTTTRAGYSASFRKSIPDGTQLNEWVVLEWDMETLSFGGTEWTTSTIERIRFDLGASADDTFAIDWIAVGRYASGGPDRITPANASTFIANAAIVDAQIGNLNASKITAGTISADRIGAGTVSAEKINGQNLVIFGGAHTAAFAWPASGNGFHLSQAGLLLGNNNTGGYFQVNNNGDLYAPGLTIVNSAASFSGNVTASQFTTIGGRFTANSAGTVIADLVDIRRRQVLQTGTIDPLDGVVGYTTEAYDQPGTVYRGFIRLIVLSDVYDFNTLSTTGNQPYYVAARFVGAFREWSGAGGSTFRCALIGHPTVNRTFSNAGNTADDGRICITFEYVVQLVSGNFFQFRLPLGEWALFKL